MHFSNATVALAVSLLTLAGCAAEPQEDEPNGSNNNNTGATSSGGSGPGSAGTNAAPGGSPNATGGTPGASGSVSASGSGSGTPGPACSAVDPTALISDFETGKAEVAATAGRDGSWFLYNDGTGTQMPVKIPNTPLAAEVGGACSSAYAFHTTGTGFNVWGAGIGTDFAPKSGEARTLYDLSAYSGIALRAKAAATTPVRVSISDINTAPEGLVCEDTTDNTNPARCGDYFGAEVTVGAEFADFTIKFSDMKQRGWGLPVAAGFDKAKAYTLRLQVKGSAQAPANFDLWLDDIRLVP
jgi:hypothetical protein